MLNSQKYAKHLASLLVCLAIPFTAVAETRISGPFILENKSEGALELYGVIQGESYLAEMLLNPHAENPNNPHRWNNEAELMAQTKGVGTVWCGLLYWALKDILPDFLPRLGIPDNYALGYAMLFGYPAFSYYRTVERDPIPVSVADWK